MGLLLTKNDKAEERIFLLKTEIEMLKKTLMRERKEFLNDLETISLSNNISVIEFKIRKWEERNK